jgi:hypothetical protein
MLVTMHETTYIIKQKATILIVGCKNFRRLRNVILGKTEVAVIFYKLKYSLDVHD